MRRFVTQRFRPTRPPGRSGPLDRTAGGIGGAAPASLDLYGQSSKAMFLWSSQNFDKVDLIYRYEDTWSTRQFGGILISTASLA
jgi:hypothetical protein